MVAMAYVLVLAIVALEVPLALSMRQRLEAEVKQQARSSASVVALLARDAIKDNDAAGLHAIVDASENGVRGRIVVVDAVGNVLADSADQADVGRNMASRPEIASGLEGRSTQVTRESQTLGRELLATVEPVVHDRRTEGAVRITQDVADVSKAFSRTVAGLVLIGLAVLAAGLIAAAVIARQTTRPIRRFERAAREVAGGDLTARAPVEGSSEQQELALAFNEMTDRLAGSLAAQSQFVADASHQLRTPLTGLRLRLEEAAARSNDDAVREQIAHAIDETDRLARTVEELLVLSQTGERDSRPERIDLATLVRDAGDRWQPIAEAAGNSLTLALHDSSEVDASRADLDRVLDALVENAIDYSPPHGNVEIELAGRQVTVRDHGPGIVGDNAEELFARFRRGSAGAGRGGGTGLGLSIARELARRWGAEVTIENTDEGGALVTLSFDHTGGGSAA